jgi:ABC-type Mn2+/Zn2+ transport system permease subunit
MEFVLALIMGGSLGGAAGYLGTLMLSQRMALVAGPLGHLTLPGIALAMIVGFDVSLGAFPFVILGGDENGIIHGSGNGRGVRRRCSHHFLVSA